MSLARTVQSSQYFLAIATVAGVTVARILLDQVAYVDEHPYLLYYLAVIVSAWVGGLSAGLLATIFSVVCIDYFFLGGSRYSMRMRHGDVVPLVTFIVEGALISWLSSLKKRALEQVEQSRTDLEDRVLRRTDALRQTNASLLSQLEENRRNQEELRAFSEQLERSNRELQDFASVASHDLQEPLRKIQAFGDRLHSRCEAGLGPEGVDYLNRMQNAAGRMQVLINDLLLFARVTTKARPFEAVNLNQVACEVVSDLESTIESSGGRVEIGPMPTIDADPVQMRQLLQNLIANGLKFQPPAAEPLVRVEARIIAGGGASSSPTCELTVADNGIGFDEKYLDRIFNIFQRLHGRGIYEGTGIGLAVCRKIVERHGGTVTARSTPGEGSTFIIRLPVTRPEGEKAAVEKVAQSGAPEPQLPAISGPSDTAPTGQMQLQGAAS